MKTKSLGPHILFFWLIITFMGPADFACGAELFQVGRSVRALGMGNAYAPVVRDADSLFYNPAGLAQVKGINWTILDLFAEANGIEVFKKLQDVQGSETFSKTVKNLYGERVGVAVGGKSAVTLPYFGLAIYDHANANLDVNNPAYPNMDIAVINDLGVALGFGVPISPMVHVGVALHRRDRTGARAQFGPSFIASLKPDAISKSILKSGIGYSADIGMNIKIPVPGPFSPIGSLVWRNVEITKFKAKRNKEAPPSDEDDMAVGLALGIDSGLVSITPALEFKHLNRSEEQFSKKIHFGVELGLLMADIRAGFYQGYYTLGAGLNFNFLRMDIATYGVELGEYTGQRESRRYVAQLTLELGFDMGLHFLGSGDGGRGRGSSWARKRLKQRR